MARRYHGWGCIRPGGDVDQILQAIEETGIRVRKILLTHGHLDHVGGAMELKEQLDVELVGPHIDDKAACENVETIAASYGLGTGMKNAFPDRWVAEGDLETIGGIPFDIFHCPGHSPGSVVFYNSELKFAHVGDVLFQGSVGRTDLPGGDHDALITSIKQKLLPLGDDIGFFAAMVPAARLAKSV